MPGGFDVEVITGWHCRPPFSVLRWGVQCQGLERHGQHGLGTAPFQLSLPLHVSQNSWDALYSSVLLISVPCGCVFSHGLSCTPLEGCECQAWDGQQLKKSAMMTTFAVG